MEKRHKIDLTHVQVRYSENIDHAFTFHPANLSKQSRETKNEYSRKATEELREYGLRDHEIETIDLSRTAIYVPRQYEQNPTQLEATLCEEWGHAAAYELGIMNRTANEGIALAHRFMGLLLSCKEGKLTLEAAIDQIRQDLNGLKATSTLFSGLERMGVKFPQGRPGRHHEDALFVIREFNPELEFRNRDPDKLIEELEKSIDYITRPSERLKWNLKKTLRKLSRMTSSRRTCICGS